MGIPIPYLSGGVSFIQKELKKELSTNKSRKKGYPEELSNKNIIQINTTLYQTKLRYATLYQTNYTTPLYIKHLKRFLFYQYSNKQTLVSSLVSAYSFE